MRNPYRTFSFAGGSPRPVPGDKNPRRQKELIGWGTGIKVSMCNGRNNGIEKGGKIKRKTKVTVFKQNAELAAI